MTTSQSGLEFCEQFQIQEYEAIAEDFLQNILGLSLEECFLSDESDLDDFSLMSSSLNTEERTWDEVVIERVQERYGVELATTRIYLVALFAMIERSRNKTLQ